MRVFSSAAPPFMKNGFVVWCDETREAVIVDPGDEVEDLLRHVETAHLDVQAILLTHAHLDHITGVGAVKAALDVPAWLHHDDLPLYDAVVEQGLMFGLRIDRQPPVDEFFTPGEPFAFGHLTVDISHTPGHSPGGVCLAIGPRGKAERQLFDGDTLFAGSIGRTDLPGGSYETLIRSIKDVLFRYSDDTVVRPGHGPDTTIGRERASNPFLMQERRSAV